MKINKADTKFRVVIVDLPNGEKEYLATNLDKKSFSYDDIKNVYSLRTCLPSLQQQRNKSQHRHLNSILQLSFAVLP